MMSPLQALLVVTPVGEANALNVTRGGALHNAEEHPPGV
jgi:hypothetical protein